MDRQLVDSSRVDALELRRFNGVEHDLEAEVLLDCLCFEQVTPVPERQREESFVGLDEKRGRCRCVEQVIEIVLGEMSTEKPRPPWRMRFSGRDE